MSAHTATLPHPATSDNWADGECGRFWGRYGAAGLLVQNPGGLVLLQLRAEWCDQPGTWGIPGGAREAGESPLDAALRELAEEHLASSSGLDVIGSQTVDYGYWSYVTFVARATADWAPGTRTAEVADARWVAPDRIDALPLHPGLAGSWPELARLLR